ncbi:ankyrin repeat domain-containing protein [Deltaproteobacteria bacterium TL4]
MKYVLVLVVLSMVVGCGSAKVQTGAKDINAAIDNKGTTLLMMAVYKNEFNTVQMLIKKGADVQARDQDGWTVLMFAVQSRDLETVKFLINNHADPSIKNKRGQTVLDLANASNQPEMVRFLWPLINKNG